MCRSVAKSSSFATKCSFGWVARRYCPQDTIVLFVSPGNKRRAISNEVALRLFCTKDEVSGFHLFDPQVRCGVTLTFAKAKLTFDNLVPNSEDNSY